MELSFNFLKEEFPILANFGRLAEQYCFSDPNSCLTKLGMIGETIVNLIFYFDHIPFPDDNTAAKRIRTLQREGLISRELADSFHALRIVRNKAAHENYDSEADCLTLLSVAYELCEWFMMTYGDWNYQPTPYIVPTKDREIVPVKASESVKQAEAKQAASMMKAAEQKASVSNKITKTVRKNQSAKVSANHQLTEAETRLLIDEQLQLVGWEANTTLLRYLNGTRPEKGKNRAIAEWPTDSVVRGKGYADYALFVGLELVGIIEAKAEHIDVSSVVNGQCLDYASGIKERDAQYVIGHWGSYQVPFVFAANGRPYLEQYKEKSGIWFRDLRAASNAPNALAGWMSPEGIKELLQYDEEAAKKKLAAKSYDHLRVGNELHLYDYQEKAIRKVEETLAKGQRNILVAMATGTGKTRVALGMIYRFLDTKRFRHILFLVDRITLGEQAFDKFKEVKLDGLYTLNDIFQITQIGDVSVDPTTRLHITTVQGMAAKILNPKIADAEMAAAKEQYRMPAVTDYDLIIADEAHRGYILDREMSDEEMLYRDQQEFQSTYRRVLDYFNAVKIGLTATPAQHTIDIFGQSVFTYRYRDAVLENHLVDHDAPYNMETVLNQNNINIPRGEAVQVYDPNTNQISTEVLPDEISFDVSQFNRTVITPEFDRVVLNALMDDLDPEDRNSGKTLIFAVNDAHADRIVSIIQEICQDRGINMECVRKITHKAGNGDRKRVKELIRRFKERQFPSIAVTVDLLSTGIDVPEITTLVFMRKIKSRILYEQMLGRATRPCPEINKTHFNIYDPVRLYEDLDHVTDMKPVVKSAAASLTQLLGGLPAMETEDQVNDLIQQIAAKILRKQRKMSEQTLNNFKTLSGGKSPDEFVTEMLHLPPQDAKTRLLALKDLFEMTDRSTPLHDKVVLSDAEDHLIRVTRGYGKGNSPEDYLSAFAQYVRDNMNENAAMRIICTRPKDLTRKDLASLWAALDLEDFTKVKLGTAIRETSNQEMAVDIIGLIRQYAIGSPMISPEERVHRAIVRLRAAHSFNKRELNWLERFENYLIENNMLRLEDFDTDDRFADKGGFKQIDKVFNHHLTEIVAELNDYLYDDGGKGA